ncbi:DNA-processing protein DprA [Aeromicrobium sp.]|uniref:DNA-processing protein DprA n=1 Tax=Aeromicrobium sp. TaxID=1871063 RepID=UPI0025C69D6D|nr:DNA-processing protein DprA [Aeromicrobium sp.]MCK5890737.1 DNA-processing protein DprA [Aeromicrobium sp.]
MNRGESERDRLVLSIATEPLDALARDLVSSHGIAAVAGACRGESGSPHVPEAWVERVALAPVDQVLDAGAAARARWITPAHPAWPAALGDLAGVDDHGAAPWGVWVRGEGPLEVDRAVSVVGARSCTTYGAEVAGDLGADLADRGWTVVSGAAFGIDACAHRGALAVAGRTVAVLACGVDVPYPQAHATLLDRIAHEGWIIAEHPPGSVPHRHRFLTRNRLIAALGAGTVVVEAAPRSGSLNTLRWADRLGRSSMAVPGSVLSQQSGGAHRAVREGEAVLVTSADDVAQELDGLGWSDLGATETLTDDSRRLHATLPREGGVTVGELVVLLDASLRQVRAGLALLERRGHARRADGGWIALGPLPG